MKSFPTILILFLGSFLFSSFEAEAQTPIAIQSNDFVTTTIFFPSNIKKVVSPGANFQFTYEEGTNIGLLKARKGKESNLLVITDQGYVYSFALSYAEEVLEFNFILSPDQAITRNTSLAKAGSQGTKTANAPKISTDNPIPADQNQNPSETATASSNTDNLADANQQANMTSNSDTLVTQNNTIPEEPLTSSFAEGEDDLYDVDREEYYRIYCENNYLQKTSYKRSFRQNKRIAVRLNNILTDRNEKYFVLQIENNSKREYKVAGLSFFRKSDVGQLEKIMNPLFSFNLQENIDPESVNEVVYVFKNFTISAKEKIIVALADANSDNMVLLPLDNLLINSPSN